MIIHVLRKPLTGTVAANVLAHGTGALNIDGCRVAGPAWTKTDGPAGAGFRSGKFMGGAGVGAPTQVGGSRQNSSGRWPANFVLDEAAAAKLDEQVPNAGGGFGISGGSPDGNGIYSGSFPRGDRSVVGYGDCGSASRFFQKVDL